MDIYRATCESCNKSFKLKYGTIKKDEVYEIFACPKCKILFSLKNFEKLECPKCKNTKLIRYSPNKSSEMNFFENMKKKKLLKKKDYDLIIKYWNSIENDKCPCCSKKKLKWIKE